MKTKLTTVPPVPPVPPECAAWLSHLSRDCARWALERDDCRLAAYIVMLEPYSTGADDLADPALCAAMRFTLTERWPELIRRILLRRSEELMDDRNAIVRAARARLRRDAELVEGDPLRICVHSEYAAALAASPMLADADTDGEEAL